MELNHLPVEIIDCIASYFRPRDWVVMRQVCRLWNEYLGLCRLPEVMVALGRRLSGDLMSVDIENFKLTEHNRAFYITALRVQYPKHKHTVLNCATRHAIPPYELNIVDDEFIINTVHLHYLSRERLLELINEPNPPIGVRYAAHLFGIDLFDHCNTFLLQCPKFVYGKEHIEYQQYMITKYHNRIINSCKNCVIAHIRAYPNCSAFPIMTGLVNFDDPELLQMFAEKKPTLCLTDYASQYDFLFYVRIVRKIYKAGPFPISKPDKSNRFDKLITEPVVTIDEYLRHPLSECSNSVRRDFEKRYGQFI